MLSGKDPDTKGQILYDSIYVKYLELSNSRETKQIKSYQRKSEEVVVTA